MVRFLRLLAWGFVVTGLVITALGGAVYWVYRDVQAPGPLAATRILVIPPHTKISGIAALLADSGVIRHRLSFEWVAKIAVGGAGLRAGEYEFPAGASAVQALEIIAGGRTVK